MIIDCPQCRARYRFDETKLGTRPRARTRCAKCGGAIDIENPLLASMTLPPAPEPAPEPRPAPDERHKTARRPTLDPDSTGREIREQALAELIPGKRYSLAVLAGEATGKIIPLSKARMTLGRSGADVVVDDAEASRQHASLEILGDHAVLRDLGSTNGTFVDSEQIQQHVLQNHGEFRIGSHVLMFIVTDAE
jgi:predicted Zn finger-like uncharacterized protein